MKTAGYITGERMAEFIHENIPTLRAWSPNTLLQWIGFCGEQGFCLPIASTLRHPKLEGLAIARPVMTVDQMSDPYAFDPEGRFIYVDVAIAKTPEMLRGIALGLQMRFGVRDGIFWHRRERALRGYGARKLLSKILAQNHVSTRS